MLSKLDMRFGVWGVLFLPFSDMVPVVTVTGEHPIDRTAFWTRDGKPSDAWFDTYRDIAYGTWRENRVAYGLPISGDDEYEFFDGPADDPANWAVKELPSRYRNADGSSAIFVNVYSVGRSYGGPEEGGWWFDCGTPVESYIVATLPEAHALRDRLTGPDGEYAYTGKRGSVLGGNDYEVMIETDPGTDYPSNRPHYE